MKKACITVLVSLLALALLAPTAFAWELERPVKYIIVDDRTDNSFTDEKASVGLGIHIVQYTENEQDSPFHGGDGFKLRVVATGNTRKILGYGVGRDDGSTYRIEGIYQITFTFDPQDGGGGGGGGDANPSPNHP